MKHNETAVAQRHAAFHGRTTKQQTRLHKKLDEYDTLPGRLNDILQA